MESLEPAKSLVDQAYHVILEALCDGTFKAGERLTQEDIAAKLNVSCQPVTHALAMLKAQGFLAQEGRRGLCVTSVGPGFLESIYQLRSAVEPLAVTLATPRLSKAAVHQGRKLIERGKTLLLADDSLAVLKADMDFHSFIYDLSGNVLIGDTMRLHWQHLRRGMGQVLRFPGMTLSVWQEHSRIFEQMARGNGERAAELMREHLVGAYDRVSAQADGSTGKT